MCRTRTSAAVGFCVILSLAASAADSMDYPCWRGDGSGASPSAGRPLVRTLAGLKPAWVSQADNLVSSYNLIQGGSAGPVFADGRVYINYLRPGGDVYAEEYIKAKMTERKVSRLKRKKNVTEDYLKWGCLVAADDVVLCIDARTGRTVFEFVEPEAALNTSMSVRGIDKSQKSGPHAVPCVAYGKVLAIGGLGNIYCLDARTGQAVWKIMSPRARERVAEAKARRKPGKVNRYENCTCPTFAGGVFVVPRGRDVVGLDPNNGRQVWRVKDVLSRTCSPIRWVHQGSEFIIAGVTAIEPRTGKIMWKAPGGKVENFTPACTEDRLVQAVEEGGAEGFGGWAISPAGARPLWRLGKEYEVANYCSPVILNDMIIGKIDAEQRGRSHLIVLNVDTGEEIGRTPNFRSDACASMVAGDNIAIYEDGLLVLDNPRQPQLVWNTFSRGDCHPLYADSHTSCLVGGLWFVRGQTQVRCYDLRAR